jgi:hypothetical protein
MNHIQIMIILIVIVMKTTLTNNVLMVFVQIIRSYTHNDNYDI